MTKKKKYISLQAKLFITLIGSLLIAAIVFGILHEFGSFLVWRYYLNDDAKSEREDKYISDFQEYVKENMLYVDDSERISSYNAGRYVDLIIYKDSSLVYAPDWFKDFSSEGESGDADESESEAGGTFEEAVGDETEVISGTAAPDTSAEESVTDGNRFYENWFSGDRGFERFLTEEARDRYRATLNDLLSGNSTLHPVYFLDGTLIVSVVDYSEEYLNNIVFAVSVVSALAVVAILMIVYFNRMARRMKKLAADVRIVENGDLSHRISARGDDEIAFLAEDVNSMRNSIVDNMTKERQAWEANAGLITAMSHDIRTPLTVLMGYLDLIELQNSDEISSEYISACKDNAMRLKNLSDEMFSYFLVFGKSETSIQLTHAYADDYLEHIIAEHMVLLVERGYILRTEGDIPHVKVSFDERYICRVVDNIFSNIIKYAAPDRSVSIIREFDGKRLSLIFENAVRTDRDIPESNKIGLLTCTRMMQDIGGELLYCEESGIFRVEMVFFVPDGGALQKKETEEKRDVDRADT